MIPKIIPRISARIGNTNDKTTRKAIKAVMAKCYLGDWFVLIQISKNVNMYFFRAFMRELRHELTPASRKPSFNNKHKMDTLTKQPPTHLDDENNSDVEGNSSSSLIKKNFDTPSAPQFNTLQM